MQVRGKLIRRPLKTNQLAVARLRLASLEKVERQQVELQGAIANGNVSFAGGVQYRTLLVQKARQIFKWCAREDLNLQPFRDQILSLARLPFRHARIVHLQRVSIKPEEET